MSDPNFRAPAFLRSVGITNTNELEVNRHEARVNCNENIIVSELQFINVVNSYKHIFLGKNVSFT